MSILDFVETWWFSVRTILEAAGVVIRFERSTGDRLKHSCNLNLRRGDLEADLMVWESGEAEFAVVEADGSVSQKHFDDIRNRQDLGSVLSRLASMATATRST
jgi:hypothetical protein